MADLRISTFGEYIPTLLEILVQKIKKNSCPCSYSKVKPTENATVSFFTLGEGWHNYHHSFPWDYKAAELPGYGLNGSTGFIRLMAWLGLAYDLKTPSKELIAKVSVNKGDGTASKWGNDHHKQFQEQQKVKTR